ncbi:MAG: manganese transporter, partial [Acidimicrobiales bacterium]|nr:manganese transporter [Acidimicrobiales bacterium]
AGVLVCSASVYVLLLCNDREVLGPWVNKPWLNALATVIISGLLYLSLILVITTLFTNVNVPLLLGAVGAVVVAGLMIASVPWARRRARAEPIPAEQMARRETWRMPPLALLGRPPWSRGRLVTMWGLRIYLVVAVVILLVKAVQLGSGVH